MFSDAEDGLVKPELLQGRASSGAVESNWHLAGCTSLLPSWVESESPLSTESRLSPCLWKPLVSPRMQTASGLSVFVSVQSSSAWA